MKMGNFSCFSSMSSRVPSERPFFFSLFFPDFQRTRIFASKRVGKFGKTKKKKIVSNQTPSERESDCSTEWDGNRDKKKLDFLLIPMKWERRQTDTFQSQEIRGNSSWFLKTFPRNEFHSRRAFSTAGVVVAGDTLSHCHNVMSYALIGKWGKIRHSVFEMDNFEISDWMSIILGKIWRCFTKWVQMVAGISAIRNFSLMGSTTGTHMDNVFKLISNSNQISFS